MAQTLSFIAASEPRPAAEARLRSSAEAQGQARLRLLLLTVGLGIGGTEEQIKELAVHLDRRRYDVTVCALKGDGVMAQELRALGLPVVLLEGKGKGDVLVLHRLYRLVRALRPDIIHAFLGSANLGAALVGRLLPEPILVWSYRDLDVWRRGPHWMVDRWAVRRAEAVTCCSDSVRRFVMQHMGLSPERITTIHNGVDRARFDAPASPAGSQLGLRAQLPVVGTVCRLDEPKKGLAVLLQAMRLATDRGDAPAWQLLIVGEGPAREGLERLSARLGLSERVIFAGPRRDVAAILPLMDLFVCPSLYEGFGIAIVEAMMAGRPVVASSVGGITEIVRSGDTGLLVPPGDPAALAAAIQEVLRQPELAARFGWEGKRRAETEFSVDTMVERHQALYESLAGAAGPRKAMQQERR